MSRGADIEPHNSLRDPFRANSDQSEYDAIAELFLGETPAALPSQPAPPKPQTSRQFFELVTLGHLPGAASAWVAQYAGAVAAVEDEPIALIRTAEGELSIEIIGETDAAPRATTIDDAVRTIQSITRRVLLRLDRTDAFGETPFIRTDAITVLTGADDAAIVAAYQTLKSLGADARLERSTQIRAAIMGADASVADRAIEQLRRAVSTFMDGALTQAPSVHRIGPVARTTIYRAPFNESASALVDRLQTPSKQSPETVVAAPAPTPQPVSNPETVISEAPAILAQPSNLAGRLPSVIAIESRCPYHESVELAAGLTGELHALTDGGVDQIGALLAVESWAKDHAKLLAKAEPALRAPDADAALHLFTDSPAEARHLLNTKLRVHVLAKPGPDGFVCLPLNYAD